MIRYKVIQKVLIVPVLIIYYTIAVDVKYVHVHTVYQKFSSKVA